MDSNADYVWPEGENQEEEVVHRILYLFTRDYTIAYIAADVQMAPEDVLKILVEKELLTF